MPRVGDRHRVDPVPVDPPNTTTPDAAGGQSAAVAQATATPAGNSAQTVASTIPQLLSSAATPQALQPSAAATAYLPWPSSLIYNTINNFLTKGLPTPTNNWLGLAPSQYTAILKQTLQAYFGVGLGQLWVLRIGQQTGQRPGYDGRAAAAPGFRHRSLPPWEPVAGLLRTPG